MKISYKPLWRLLLEKDMGRMELREVAGISTCTLAKLGKNEPVKLDMLIKICEALECRIEEIIELVDDNHNDLSVKK